MTNTSFKRYDYILLDCPQGPLLCLVADLNDDGFVNSIDFTIMLSCMGQPSPECDVNGDGVVDSSDFSIFFECLKSS